MLTISLQLIDTEGLKLRSKHTSYIRGIVCYTRFFHWEFFAFTKKALFLLCSLFQLSNFTLYFLSQAQGFFLVSFSPSIRWLYLIILLFCLNEAKIKGYDFALIGIHWVMAKRVIDLFNCWQGSLGRHQNFVIWKAIPHCLMWCLWRERNARVFEGCEICVLELKLQFYHFLMDWMSAIGLVRFTNILEFIDSCSF